MVGSEIYKLAERMEKTTKRETPQKPVPEMQKRCYEGTKKRPVPDLPVLGPC